MPRLPSPALLPILLIVFVDVLGFTVVIPLLPLYAEGFGATPALVGALIATYALCGLVAAPLLGRWSDRHGRRPVLLLSQCGSLLGFIMLAQAPSLAWLFAARALDGFTAANIVTARAWIADVTPPKERTAAFGLIGAAFGFGYMVGPAMAGLLAQWGERAPLWVAAALSAASILCTLLLLPKAAPPARSAAPAPKLWTLLSQGEPARRLWQFFAFLFAFSLFTAGIALFCERRLRWDGAAFGVTEIGLLLGYVGVLGLLTQLVLLRPLLRRYGEARLVRLGLGIGALGYAGLGTAHSLPLALLALGLCGIANSAVRPGLLGLISQGVAPEHQGRVFGWTQSLQLLAMVLAPLLAGALIESGWLSAWAAACALSLLVARWLSPRR